MMEMTRIMEIERECERLITMYCHYVDHDEAARIADLFIDEGMWKNINVTMEGQEAIRAGFQKRQDNRGRMSRHICTNTLINVVSDSEATGVVYMSLYFHDGEPGRETSPTDCLQKLGEYRDHYVKTGNGWRFASREVVSNFWHEDS
jgi:hypothetical protein